MDNKGRPIPPIHKKLYSVVYYHTITGSIMKYKFTSKKNADSFYDRLPSSTRPVMYVSERIR